MKKKLGSLSGQKEAASKANQESIGIGRSQSGLRSLLATGLVAIGAMVFNANALMMDYFVEDPQGEVVIDFEEGFQDGQLLESISVSGVEVTIGTLSPSGRAYIAEVGGDTTGFAPRDDAFSHQAGQFFVSDEADRLSDRFDYFVDFSSDVSNLSLDAYDYRADGGGRVGDTVTLNAYNAMNTLIGSDVYTITGREIDGVAYTFGVQADGIRRVELVHSGSDVGTGIDNLSFDVGVSSAPEPAEWAMIGMGALVMGGALRRKRDGQETA